jgi:hypothetical protein
VEPDLFEQPVSPATSGGELAAWAALAEIREATGLAVAIDEMVARPEDVLRARDEDAADAVNIKIMRTRSTAGRCSAASSSTCDRSFTDTAASRSDAERGDAASRGRF